MLYKYLHKTITTCNVYIPPCFNVAQSDLDNLVNQLHAPFLFIGDFNAHSNLWGWPLSNNLGNKVEHLESSVSLLNDRSPTYFHPASGSFTSIDLSLCSASVFLDFTWQVHSDQCGSDHFPILLIELRVCLRIMFLVGILKRLIGQNSKFSVL